jgi:NitT/TauT family transport system substrate-binding protein
MKVSGLFVILGAMFMVLLTGCHAENEMTEVKLAEVTRSIFYAPQYVALSEGFFEEEGLDIDLTTTWGGDTTMTTLLSDGAEIALVGAETSIYVYAQEANDPAINFGHAKHTIMLGN